MLDSATRAGLRREIDRATRAKLAARGGARVDREALVLDVVGEWRSAQEVGDALGFTSQWASRRLSVLVQRGEVVRQPSRGTQCPRFRRAV